MEIKGVGSSVEFTDTGQVLMKNEYVISGVKSEDEVKTEPPDSESASEIAANASKVKEEKKDSKVEDVSMETATVDNDKEGKDKSKIEDASKEPSSTNAVNIEKSDVSELVSAQISDEVEKEELNKGKIESSKESNEDATDAGNEACDSDAKAKIKRPTNEPKDSTETSHLELSDKKDKKKAENAKQDNSSETSNNCGLKSQISNSAISSNFDSVSEGGDSNSSAKPASSAVSLTMEVDLSGKGDSISNVGSDVEKSLSSPDIKKQQTADVLPSRTLTIRKLKAEFSEKFKREEERQKDNSIGNVIPDKSCKLDKELIGEKLGSENYKNPVKYDETAKSADGSKLEEDVSAVALNNGEQVTTSSFVTVMSKNLNDVKDGGKSITSGSGDKKSLPNGDFAKKMTSQEADDKTCDVKQCVTVDGTFQSNDEKSGNDDKSLNVGNDKFKEVEKNDKVEEPSHVKSDISLDKESCSNGENKEDSVCEAKDEEKPIEEGKVDDLKGGSAGKTNADPQSGKLVMDEGVVNDNGVEKPSEELSEKQQDEKSNNEKVTSVEDDAQMEGKEAESQENKVKESEDELVTNEVKVKRPRGRPKGRNIKKKSLKSDEGEKESKKAESDDENKVATTRSGHVRSKTAEVTKGGHKPKGVAFVEDESDNVEDKSSRVAEEKVVPTVGRGRGRGRGRGSRKLGQTTAPTVTSVAADTDDIGNMKRTSRRLQVLRNRQIDEQRELEKKRKEQDAKKLQRELAARIKLAAAIPVAVAAAAAAAAVAAAAVADQVILKDNFFLLSAHLRLFEAVSHWFQKLYIFYKLIRGPVARGKPQKKRKCVFCMSSDPQR